MPSFDAGEFTATPLIGALVPVIMAITVLFALSQQGSGGFVHGRRVVSYAFGLFGAVIAAGPGAADAQTSSNQRVNAVSHEHPVPRLMSSVLPRHPEAEFRPIVVAVRVTVDERGHVSDVRPLGPAREKYVFYVSHPTGGEVVARAPNMSGPPPPDPSFEAFAQSVLEAVRSWQYEPPRGGRLAFDLTFGFTPRGEAQLLAHGVSVVEPPPRSGPDWAKPRDMLRVEPEWLRQTIRAGGEVSPPTKLKDFAADYPPIAWSARVQGTVTLDALVGPDGRVQDAYVVRSIPLLDSAAFDAVKQWEFTPPLRKGRPVPVILPVTVQFTLAH